VQGSDKEGLLKKGLEAIAQGDTLSALSYFEKAINIEKSPAVCSSYAFCIAKERGQVSNAISLCEEAIQKEPGNSLHYLNLGRIYLIDNNRVEAIKTFREGLNYEANPLIVDELNKLGPRKPPIFPFLKRSNPINRYLGIVLRSKKWLRMFYILLSLLLAVVASLLLPRLFLEKPEAPSPPLEVRPEVPPSPLEDMPEVSPAPLEVKPKVAPSAPEVIHETPPKKPEVKQQVAPPPEVKHDKHTLELIAEDTTWIFITIDDAESKEILLNTGEHITLSAKNVFSLKIGNAGGIKLIFDRKEIGPLGEKGQVVTLKLPSSTIPTSDAVKKNSETQ
jgi:tetratricopeptide (TPR) repeat protein